MLSLVPWLAESSTEMAAVPGCQSGCLPSLGGADLGTGLNVFGVCWLTSQTPPQCYLIPKAAAEVVGRQSCSLLLEIKF